MIDKQKQFANLIEELVYDGCAYVQITDDIPCNRVPKSFFDLCLHLGFSPENLIQMILSDYMLRLDKGNKHYQNDVINRIMNSDLPNKKEIMRVIYE